jgi:hypothetical protein
MPELREVFEMTTKQMGEPDVDSWQKQEKRQRKASRNKKLGAFALAAAIAVVAVVWIRVETRRGQDTTTPANQPPTVAPVDAKALEVAMGFLEAWGAYDADQAITFLADDADISQFGVEGPREFRLLIAFNEASGFEVMPTSCEVTPSVGSETYVHCTYDFHGIRSDEIGRGPYSGSYIDLTVRDGQIVQAWPYLEDAKFSPQMWEPFAVWVSKNYPEDVAVMYKPNYTDYRLTEESIRLWGQHSREYVKEVGR